MMGGTVCEETGSSFGGQESAQQIFNQLSAEVGLYSLSVSCLAWDNSVLEPTELYDTANSNLWGDLCQHTPPRTAAGGALSPQQVTANPSPQDTSNIHASSLSPVGSQLLFPWSVLVHPKFCLCSPRVDSLFPPVLWKFCHQILLTRVRFLRDLSPFARSPAWEAW